MGPGPGGLAPGQYHLDFGSWFLCLSTKCLFADDQLIVR